MDIILDFDGTCVMHEYPIVGADIGAVPVLKRLVERGHNLILFTMRSEREWEDGFPESYLTDAVDWFKKNDIPLYGIQTNPTQAEWTSSPKAHGQLIIDDTALGVPLSRSTGRDYVDWIKVEEMLEERGLI